MCFWGGIVLPVLVELQKIVFKTKLLLRPIEDVRLCNLLHDI